MRKFEITDFNAILNFDEVYCTSEVQIVSSKPFKLVLTRYINYLRKSKNPIIKELFNISIDQFLNCYKLLLVLEYYDVYQNNPELRKLLEKRGVFYRFTEKFYDYWRKLEKFGFIEGTKKQNVMNTSLLINTSEEFNTLVLSLYRLVSQKILGSNYNVYRQLPAGINANFYLSSNQWSKMGLYSKFSSIPFISHLLMRPPLMIYSKSNTRKGIFKEISHNPIDNISFNKNDFFGYAIMVGGCLAYVYFHKSFLHHAIALANLFEAAKFNEIKGSKPDLLYIYGVNEDTYDGTFYYDKNDGIYIGTVSIASKNDYFGYMKKMLLTLHNVYMIDKNRLPIHGAMVNILFSNGLEKNIVIIGDSGAGKSESLEALRMIGSNKVSEIRTIYDDMGVMFIKDNNILSSGTEIGAFVRLDDLDSGYAYQEIDRAIFLNPNKKNARVILPLSMYDFIMKEHKIDLVLYANNYLDTNQGLRLISNIDEAINVFSRGERFAKGTTDEIGLVKTFFANPFGPLQKEKQVKEILKNHFDLLYKTNIPVGEIYTKLAVPGHENDGPILAAEKLLEYLLK